MGFAVTLSRIWLARTRAITSHKRGPCFKTDEGVGMPAASHLTSLTMDNATRSSGNISALR
ncbi:hypothetical protein FrEUN1fDRAFT_0112 [Parafrankia sp. EUN1f]|nr:hypothetical protein FrEUN1fDRAFT_0112 [Parafrankia sp. EUN1f]